MNKYIQKTEQLNVNAIKRPKDEPVLRCIIANDIEFVLINYQMVLRQYFSHVDGAENGIAAFDLVKSRPIDFYDFIFLDINMPIMNGVEACAAISRYLREKTLKSLISV